MPPARAGEVQTPYHFLVEDDYCEGHTEKKEWDVTSWCDDQGIEDRKEIEDGFQEIVSHPWFIGGRTLDPKRMQMFHMTCYDLDTFRRFVFDSTFLKRFEVSDEEVEKLRKDDLALLKFGFRRQARLQALRHAATGAVVRLHLKGEARRQHREQQENHQHHRQDHTAPAAGW